MKNKRNHSQFQDQENSPERTNNETNLSSVTDSKFKKKIIKTWKELRKAIDTNADYCKR